MTKPVFVHILRFVMDDRNSAIQVWLLILILGIAGLCMAATSVNVPVWHWSYRAVERLSDYGLIDSAMLGTRPISRLEMAGLIQAAIDNPQTEKADKTIKASIKRLQEEFQLELEMISGIELPGQAEYIKPLEDPYIQLLNSDKPFGLENRSGDTFEEGSNLRVGMITRATLWQRFAFLLHPRYRTPYDVDTDLDLFEGYAKSQIGPLEIGVGKDSLWWGPGYHGSLILSNNAQNLGMLKVSTAHPIELPSILGYLGPFKAVFFLARLESNRDHPHARITGLRMSIKPRPWLELGGSRTILFGGSGVPGIGLEDYLAVFWPKNIQGYEDQRASLDVAARFMLPGAVPARAIKAYIEWAGEDAAGFSKYVPLVGLQVSDLFRLGNTDLRIEYATTHVDGFPNVFYNHGIYWSGYTYHGMGLGHHMGTDAQDLFVRLDHYLTDRLQIGLEYDHQRSNLSASPRPELEQIGTEVLWFAPRNWQLQFGYRLQKARSGVSDQTAHILELVATYNF